MLRMTAGSTGVQVDDRRSPLRVDGGHGRTVLRAGRCGHRPLRTGIGSLSPGDDGMAAGRRPPLRCYHSLASALMERAYSDGVMPVTRLKLREK